ncbi:tRNA pseudouridine(55) synthase TruB [Mycoplasma miroungirhinis]|uniref:tRNA pseudouridine(55) synthase n=1 Tax=Mycoplasma miroungirhinis TaxID=754516 RepID=A0A6M4JFW7_9MOLU|nr:tRNA pseudouridine(55) synthase TruB [Mycoplasma miroungirhinis]QJR43922.1 tRNA pseudouridine(55) synthase TruB [Mycoplasma miroungirhinis]
MFYALNKKKFVSSFQMIREFQKNYQIKKIGHAGTLDPLAQGLLIVATDDDTKLLDYIINQDKEYVCTMQLWAFSPSYDSQELVTYLPQNKITLKDLEDAFNKIKQQTKQTPPNYSAKNINGIRAYKLARQNQDFVLKANDIKIYSLDIIEYNLETGVIKFKTKVSKGTYIRSIVHDLGIELKTDAIMIDLFRNAIGNISITENQDFYKIIDFYKLFGLFFYKINNTQLNILNKRQTISHDKKENGKRLITYNDTIVAIAEFLDNKVNIIKIFWPQVLKEIEKRDP